MLPRAIKNGDPTNHCEKHHFILQDLPILAILGL